jgi:hypothetical protein
MVVDLFNVKWVFLLKYGVELLSRENVSMHNAAPANNLICIE